MKNLGQLEAGDNILGLQWTRDGGRLLVTPSTGEILVAGLDGLGVLERLAGHGMGNGASDWFQGAPVTCGFDGKIRHAGREIVPGRGMIDRVKSNADDTRFAAAQNRRLHVFGGAEETACAIDLHASAADFAWSPVNPVEIATAGAGGACLWRIGEDNPFARFDWGGACLGVEWSADGRWLATADQTPSVHVYDIPRDHPLHIQGFEGKVRAMAFSRDSKRLATAGSPVVTVWPCKGKKGPEGAAPIQVDGSESEVMAVDFSPKTGQLATGDGNGTLLVVTFESGQFRRKRTRLAAAISTLAWHPVLPLLAIGHASGEVMLLSLD